MAATAVAAVAGAAAAAAYFDAKYHICKDLGAIRSMQKVARVVQRAAKENKRSPWYFFEKQVAEMNDARCIWYRADPSQPAVAYSWTEAHQQCCRYAQFLLQNGVGPGDLICTYLVNSPEFMFTLMGTWAIGTAPAMINYHLSGDALIHCLKVPRSKILLVDEDSACQARIEESRSRIENELGMKIIVLTAAIKASIARMDPVRPADEYRHAIIEQSPVFLFYTSGTTGLPKACGLPTAAIATFGESRKRISGLRSAKDGDAWYDCMPLYHGTGGVSAVTCMVSGVQLAIGRRFSVRNFWKDIHDSEANGFIYVGETARYLLAAPPSQLDKTHRLQVMYGNGMRIDIWRKFMERFNIPRVNEFFNSTEGMLAMVNDCISPFHDGNVGHHGAIMRHRLRNRYVPVKIDEENGGEIWRDPKTGFAKRAAYEDGGEILITCNSKAEFGGYWNNPEATGKRFIRNVFREGDLFYRTGDALRRDADGRWFFMDRLGDSFRWKSENVSTTEVASVIGRFPKIVEANVYGVELPGHDGRAGCAAVLIAQKDRDSFDWKAFLQHAQLELPKYAVPVFLRLVEAPTPMHNNKQNKIPLRKEGVDPKAVAEGSVGRNDRLMWVSPGGDRYVPFRGEEWQSICAGTARL